MKSIAKDYSRSHHCLKIDNKLVSRMICQVHVSLVAFNERVGAGLARARRVQAPGVLSFRSKAREAPGSETARVHHARRRCGSHVAARGACATAVTAKDRRPVQQVA